MSRSRRRQPFMAITGNASAKQDKVYAHRGERRLQNRAIQLEKDDFENFLLPHKYEAPGNETYGWGRDGNQMYWEPPQYSRSADCRWHYHAESYAKWLEEQMDWYRKLLRK